MNQENTSASASPVDHIVTTEHSAVIGGQALDYVATTGTMVVESAGKKCEIFFSAYTVEGDERAADRPLTFVFNGGPEAGDRAHRRALYWAGDRR